MTENKNAKTPTDDGHVAWACQCGRAYTVTCISSKPSKQEPVAWISDSPTKGNGKQLHWTKSEAWRWSSNITPLYTAPPRREWVGLTDEEMRECAQAMDAEPLAEGWTELIKFARAIEAKLKEKNT